MTYQEAKTQNDTLWDAHRAAGKALLAVPGVGSGPMGMTPDHVKQSAEYQAAKRAERESFDKLRAFSGYFVKTFKKEMRAERVLRA